MSVAFPELVAVIEDLAHGHRLTRRATSVLEGAATSWPAPAWQLGRLSVDDVELICGERHDTVQDAARAVLDHYGV